MRSNFLGGAYSLRSLPLSAQSCINLYVEPNESGSGEPGAFYGTPGLRVVLPLDSNGTRAAHVAGGYAWFAAADYLYRIDSNFVAGGVGPLNTPSGPVAMADNGTTLVVADATGWYAVDLATNAMSLVPDSPTMSDVSFIDNYLVGAKADGTYCWANLNSTTVDALNFASAEGSPDKIVRTIADHRELWLFGTQSIEVAVVTSDPDLPFTRTSYIEQGILAPRSAAKEDNSVFWVGRNESGQGVVYVAEGYIPRRISTFAIEQAIASYAHPELATAYTYQQDGHHFYVLNFAEATWVYDINTQLWHQRAYRNTTTGELERHRGEGHAFYRGLHLLGDYANGRVYSLEVDCYTDAEAEIYRERSWHQMDAENRWITFNRGELIADMGVGLSGAQPSDWADPQVWLSWSNDGGRTWGNEHNRSLGQVGEYTRRAVWRRMGKSRTRYFRLRMTAAVRIAWRGFNLDMDVANA